MTYYTKRAVVKFLKSLYWNLGIYLVLFAVDTVSTRLGHFNLDPTTLGIVAIILARITKVINVTIQEHQELA